MIDKPRGSIRERHHRSALRRRTDRECLERVVVAPMKESAASRLGAQPSPKQRRCVGSRSPASGAALVDEPADDAVGRMFDAGWLRHVPHVIEDDRRGNTIQQRFDRDDFVWRRCRTALATRRRSDVCSRTRSLRSGTPPFAVTL
jgi:hypothetical protein